MLSYLWSSKPSNEEPKDDFVHVDKDEESKSAIAHESTNVHQSVSTHESKPCTGVFLQVTRASPLYKALPLNGINYTYVREDEERRSVAIKVSASSYTAAYTFSGRLNGLSDMVRTIVYKGNEGESPSIPSLEDFHFTMQTSTTWKARIPRHYQSFIGSFVSGIEVIVEHVDPSKPKGLCVIEEIYCDSQSRATLSELGTLIPFEKLSTKIQRFFYMGDEPHGNFCIALKDTVTDSYGLIDSISFTPSEAPFCLVMNGLNRLVVTEDLVGIIKSGSLKPESFYDEAFDRCVINIGPLSLSFVENVQVLKEE